MQDRELLEKLLQQVTEINNKLDRLEMRQQLIEVILNQLSTPLQRDRAQQGLDAMDAINPKPEPSS